MMSGSDALAIITRGRGPLVVDDLQSNANYQRHRTEWLAQGQQVKSDRRVRLGASFSLLFENRLTVWLQIQEELRWVARPHVSQLTELLDRYNPLINEPETLCASLFLDTSDQERLERFTSGYTITRLSLRLNLRGALMEASPIDPREPCIDAVNYVRFRRIRGSFTDAETLYWCDPECHEATLPTHLRRALKCDFVQASFSSRRTAHAGMGWAQR